MTDKCQAASAGGGFVFICTLPANHDYSHLPKVLPINTPKEKK